MGAIAPVKLVGSPAYDPTAVGCPRCGRVYPPAIDRCPEDGTWLPRPPVTGSLTDIDSLPPPPSHARNVGFAVDESLEPTRIRDRPEPSAVLARGTRVGDYEVETKIGEGAMGAVYRAVHPTINKRVAIKIMNPRLCRDRSAIERFTREARTVAALRHPGIVDVFSFGTLPDGRAYLIMEWLEGHSLGARIEHATIALDDALDLLDQMARALAAAHDKGIIHRDLKPDNVYLEHLANEKPTVKLLDFGLAKLADDDGQVAATQSGAILGTPLYMSPEQCKGKGVDHRTDIYALGCIGYELTCGRLPFRADNNAEVIAAHLSEEPPRPRSMRPELPESLDALLTAMLAKDPAARPTLQRVRETIAVLRGAGSIAPPRSVASPISLPPPAARASRWPLVAGALVLCGAIAFLTVWLLDREPRAVEERPPPTHHRVEMTASVDAGIAIDAAPVAIDGPVVELPPVKKPERVRVKPPPPKDRHAPPSDSGSGSARFDRGD